MKTSTLFFLVIGLTFCSAQEFNQEIKTPQGHQFLVGQITVEGLQNNPYKAWFDTSYNQYTIDKSLVGMIDKKLKDYKIKLFLGTWCGDSKRETPRIIKILREANFPAENLEIIALDRRKGYYKKSPGGEEKGLNIIKKINRMSNLILLKMNLHLGLKKYCIFTFVL